MNKEQFLAMSLPHELKGYADGKDTISGQNIYILLSCHYKATTVEVVSTVVGESDFFTDKSKFKPILHPLSDLTKEIEHKGEKFVPSIILFPTDEFEEDLGMPTHSDYAKTFISEPESRCLNIFDWLKLIEWHFDICGLIEKGEAIDVNTLPENPYK